VIRLLASIAVIGALLVTGCGSSEHSEVTEGAEDTTTTSASTTATTVTVETGGLDQLPVVVPASGSTRPPSSGPGVGRNAFLREVFDDVQSMWGRDFADGGIAYAPARLTIFTDVVHSACGTKSAQVGPFYCPADHGVYLDTRFFDVLARRVGVRLGDFAQAYIVAHEVGHHVQFLLGLTQRLRLADRHDPAGENARSVRFELQADCLAGVWVHSRFQRGELTLSDLDDALRAAAVAGSDFQQLSATGTIRPEDWTHGSSSQRRHWLTVGFEQGRPAACDTFSA
jgi:uncharacterized protein